MSIQVAEISKTFAGVTVLDRVSLDFPTGQLVALLGPSGCGKTTLLRVIAGLETADAGRVILEGEDASSTHVRERQVGFVFQHYALFRHMTVFENVAFGLRVQPRKQRPKEPEIRRRVMRLLELVQMAWLADRFPQQLSGGQRQRIALARALAVEPRVLLLDEPFGALDAQVRKELRRWLRALHDDLHVTSIFVTHDQEEALEVADRVVLMNRGRVEQVGTPDEVYEHPASPFVYGFLGAANVFHGRVEGANVRVGGATLNHDGSNADHGAEVVAFVRPHELDIVTDLAAPNGLDATVRRVLAFGGSARVELDSVEAVKAGAEPIHYEVVLPRERAVALVQGQRVRLVPAPLRVFRNEAA
ncbi:sulfate ABC transporter ATP-binding protein [uncultured Thiodictyon sp.]|uniref:sulfate/molybdate ABC transporter ATP-binding protein n=1 Tax=uncultured Thiodictyon sp. TaxID=1846217 RepID=UPI0025E1A386|nr:sulfate ABC transporter ATP-binding protein [uncultured Thiodictyon sp.]